MIYSNENEYIRRNFSSEWIHNFRYDQLAEPDSAVMDNSLYNYHINHKG